jgi:hypothetical protein
MSDSDLRLHPDVCPLFSSLSWKQLNMLISIPEELKSLVKNK